MEKGRGEIRYSLSEQRIEEDISVSENNLWGYFGPKVLEEEEYKTQRAPGNNETVGGAPLELQGDPLRALYLFGDSRCVDYINAAHFS